MPGQNSGRAFNPGRAVVWGWKYGSLLEIDDTEDDGCQGGKRKDRRSQPDSQAVIDWSAQWVLDKS